MPGIPKPFKRPSIDLSPTPGAKKAWRTLPVEYVNVGDLLKGEGKIKDIQVWRLVELHKDVIQFTNISGKNTTYNRGDHVEVFTRIE